MHQRTLLIIALFLAAGATTWLLRQLTGGGAAGTADAAHDPDYYMEDFNTLTMDEAGAPKNRLQALYMAHYPDDDTSELLKPRMEIFRLDRPPLYISADQGWVTANNEVILLRGEVQLWEDDATGKRTLQVDTSEVRVLMNEEYAETDRYATVVSGDSTITGTGMRAFFKESRLEVLDHERTTILPAPES